MLIAFPLVAVEVWFFLFFKDDFESDFFMALGKVSVVAVLFSLEEMVTAPEAPFTVKRFPPREEGDGSIELEFEPQGRAITLVSGDGGIDE